MPVVENITKEKGPWRECQKWTIDQFERMLASIEEDLGVYRVKKHRKIYLSWKIVYNKMSRVNKYEGGIGVDNGRGQRPKT